MATIIEINGEDFDLSELATSDLLEELQNRIYEISESDVYYIKDHFDWIDEEELSHDDQELVDAASEILSYFQIENILDTAKLEYLAKIFKKYKLEQFETLLPE